MNDQRVPRRVVVASHGMGDTAATWDAVVSALGPDVDVRRWTLRGHGNRPWDGPGDYSVDAAAADLADEVAHAVTASGRPIVLLGHSLGGYLSLIHALRRPQDVAAIVLVATGPGFRKPAARSAWNDYALEVGRRAGFPDAVAAVATQHDSFVMDRLADLVAVPLTHLVGERDTRFHAGAAYIHRVLPASRLIEVPTAGHHPQRSHATIVADAIAGHL